MLFIKFEQFVERYWAKHVLPFFGNYSILNKNDFIIGFVCFILLSRWNLNIGMTRKRKNDIIDRRSIPKTPAVMRKRMWRRTPVIKVVLLQNGKFSLLKGFFTFFDMLYLKETYFCGIYFCGIYFQLGGHWIGIFCRTNIRVGKVSEKFCGTNFLIGYIQERFQKRKKVLKKKILPPHHLQGYQKLFAFTSLKDT